MKIVLIDGTEFEETEVKTKTQTAIIRTRIITEKEKKIKELTSIQKDLILKMTKSNALRDDIAWQEYKNEYDIVTNELENLSKF